MMSDNIDTLAFVQAELKRKNEEINKLNGDLIEANETIRSMRELLIKLRNEFESLAFHASIKPIEAHESAFRKLVAEIDEALKEVKVG